MFFPGTEIVVASDSPSSSASAVFEDDGKTGYFYALDRSAHDQPIQDAVHVYNAAQVADRDRASDLEILWSPDGLKAGLTINGCLHALLDFEARKAYCRTNFPRVSVAAWASGPRDAWRDELADLLQ